MPDQQDPKIIKSISAVISQFKTSDITVTIEVEIPPNSGNIQQKQVIAKLQVPDPETQSAGYVKYMRD